MSLLTLYFMMSCFSYSVITNFRYHMMVLDTILCHVASYAPPPLYSVVNGHDNIKKINGKGTAGRHVQTTVSQLAPTCVK